MKVYSGKRTSTAGPADVFVTNTKGEQKALDPRHDLRNHSPDGFQWGYGGSGPAQLSLAILADCFGDKQARQWYQAFKWNVIAKIKTDRWDLREFEIHQWLKSLNDNTESRS